MANRRVVGIMCIIGTTICYGLMPSMSFLAFDVGVSTETLLFNKFLYSAILMWAFVWLRRIPCKLSAEMIRSILIVMLAYIFTATALYIAFDHISGSLATLIQFIYPAIVIVIEMIRGREKVQIIKLLAVILSFAGLVLVVWSPGLDIKITGVIFSLIAAGAYTVYVIGLASDSLKHMDSKVTAGYVLLGAAVFNFFRCIISGQPLFTESFVQLKYIVILSVVCAFIAILLFCMGVKYIGPGNASIISTLEPVCVCIFGYLLVGDVITPGMVIGGTAIVIAILMANLPEGRLPCIPQDIKRILRDDFKRKE